MKTICIFNQKGGVGKTTTTINLCSYLALQKYKVLIIDIDPQGNSTSGLGIDKRTLKNSIYDVIANDARLDDIIIESQLVENLFVAPSTMELAGAEVELIEKSNREKILQNAVNNLGSEFKFDFIFIDCPPSLGILTLNALTASNTV